jgi:Carboxypeptidase regulatory-like domain
VTCFPPCSPWCDCVNDVCQPSPVSVNAVRLRTPDGRYLQAANGGGGWLIAASVIPNTWETFLFVPPATWPLASGSQVALDVCNASWDPAGLRVRVDHHTVTLPHGRKDPGLVTYEVGGAGTRVWACGPFGAGYPAYPGDDPAERIFTLVKLDGRAPAPPGTPINPEDLVAVQINSNRGNTYFFRVADASDGAEVGGDGLTVDDLSTMFIAEFNEVRSGLGWRPEFVQCQTCAAVTAVVTRAASGTPITGAAAVALVPGHPYQGTTGADGRAALADTSNRTCVPAGGVAVQASADRYQDKSVSALVPDSGAIEVAIALDCTPVKGTIVDTTGGGVPGAVVMLRDANQNVLLDEHGNPFLATTAADGSFAFNCVSHGFVQVWTLADPSQVNHTSVIGPPGWTNVTIVIPQPTCGNLVGQVIDASTQAPISTAGVTESFGQQTPTDASGGFRFVCVRPAGPDTVYATARGYQPGYAQGIVPTAGDSAPVIIKLTPIPTVAFQIRLTWGADPQDLDSHLSGPDIEHGGRFHCYYDTTSANHMQPVSYVSLDQDIKTGHGPETITIECTPPTGGQFVAGDYHYWVRDYTGPTFLDSNAQVAICAVDSQGALTQIASYDVTAAAGYATNAPPYDLWHVVDFTLDANGTITRTDVQTFVPGLDTPPL